MASNEEIQVTVKVFGGLRELVGVPAVSVSLQPNATLTNLLDELRRFLPELHEKLQSGLNDGYINILVNGRNFRFLEGFDTSLSDGTVIAFLPPVGGG